MLLSGAEGRWVLSAQAGHGVVYNPEAVCRGTIRTALRFLQGEDAARDTKRFPSATRQTMISSSPGSARIVASGERARQLLESSLLSQQREEHQEQRRHAVRRFSR